MTVLVLPGNAARVDAVPIGSVALAILVKEAAEPVMLFDERPPLHWRLRMVVAHRP